MLSFLRDLTSYTEWANAVFFNTWSKSSVRDQEELRSRMEHIIGVQHAFLMTLQGENPGSPPDGPPPSFDELLDRAKTGHTQFRKYVYSLDETMLSRTAHFVWFPDPPCIITVGEAVVQVAMHTQHHRGQLMTRLKDLGGNPKNVDWIIWLWKKKPEANWNSTESVETVGW